MSGVAIDVKSVGVSFRPYTEGTPTLRRTIASRRRKRREPVPALVDVTFQVRRGEAFGVVGHNGAGKSTLLKVMAGTLLPDEGMVTRYGKLSTLLSLGVGFVPELTGRRNVYLGGLASGLTRREIEARFDEIVDYAELWDAIDRPLKTYSSGMFSRLAFSVGMFMDPEILLLDEVLAVGDEAFRRKSLDSMQRLLDSAGTIVFVSHALDRLAEFCDRAMWLDRGRVRAVGPAYEVVGQYKDEVEKSIYRTTSPKPGGPWTANQKAEAVLRLIAGARPEYVAGEMGARPEQLDQWRTEFVRAGRETFKLDRPKASEDVS